MAWYSYKNVCHSLPDKYVDEAFEAKYKREFDGDPNYDGDYWLATSDYIEDLLAEIKQLKEGN